MEEGGEEGGEDKAGLVRESEEKIGALGEGRIFIRMKGEVLDEGGRVSVCSVGEEETISISCETEAGEGGEDQDMIGEGILSPVGVFREKEKERGESVLWEVERVFTSTEEIGREGVVRDSTRKDGGDISGRMEKRGEGLVVMAATISLVGVMEKAVGLGFCGVCRRGISFDVMAGVTVGRKEEGEDDTVGREEEEEDGEEAIRGRLSVVVTEVEDEGLASTLGVFSYILQSPSTACSIWAYILATTRMGVFEEEGKQIL